MTWEVLACVFAVLLGFQIYAFLQSRRFDRRQALILLEVRDMLTTLVNQDDRVRDQIVSRVVANQLRPRL